MTAGNYHYMEARHYEKWGTDFFSIAVHIAQTVVTGSSARSPETHRIHYRNTNEVREKWEYTINQVQRLVDDSVIASDYSALTYHLGFVWETDAGQCSTKQKDNNDDPTPSPLSIEASASDFKNFIGRCYERRGVDKGFLEVTREDVDANGDVTAVDADKTGYKYTVTVNFPISPNHISEINAIEKTVPSVDTVTTTFATASPVITQTGTGPLSGFFKLQVARYGDSTTIVETN